MAEQNNASKTRPKSRIRWFKRPEFILLLLTGFLWLAFLLKVFFIADTEVETGVEAANSTISPGNPKKSIPNAKTSPHNKIKLQSAQARSRNKLSTEQVNAREDQEYVDTIRESFDQVKHAKNNQIIRGEIVPATEEPIDKLSGQLQILVDDKFEMDSLNAEYQRALKGRN